MASSDGVRDLFAPPRVLAADGGEPGELLLRPAGELGEYPVTVVHSLREWAGIAPEHPLISERARGDWRTVSYGRAVAAADGIGQALLDRGLGPGRPLLVLSGNGVDHLLVMLDAMTAGIPAVVSAGHRDGAEHLSVLMNTNPGEAVRTAFANLSPDGTAKILFTSGSTGAPKGVLNTHRMLAANQQMIRQAWPFLGWERPVIVDWLPWSHTFGGNHNLNMMISSGGTLHVDAGRPVPALFGQTIRNLTDVPPTIYFNVPAGYAQLVPALEADPEFAARFFSRLRLVFNAAAALPAALRDRLAAVAERTVGRQVPVTGSWGATETAPAVTSAHFPFTDARCIGVPLPGAEVKLVPADGDACEIRVRGPMVTPGYFGRPDLTAAAFDADGFYRTGDAVALADPADPSAGLVFRGRIAEDFKLASGTFVRVGAVRTRLLSAIPVLSDAVLAGENRDYVSALGWLNAAEARRLLGGEPAADGELIVHGELHKLLAGALGELGDAAGSAARVERLALLASPASLDAGEITDKGYINQRRVLARRADLVDMLYADPVPAGVVVAERTF
jgi:feruloyl-CoA synthase